MKKKHIAFVMGTILLGGAERALINLLNGFDYERYDVTLWICGDEPGATEKINSNVHISYVSSEFALPDGLREGARLYHPRKLLARLLAKSNRKDDARNKFYYSKSLPPITDTCYDCVIAYRGWDVSILRFAFLRLKGKQTAVWMHNDTYSTEFPYPYFYQKADRIFCVSKTIRQHLLERYPGVPGERVDVIYNALDREDIFRKAEAEPDQTLKHPCILSVGRLSWEKNFEIIPETARVLREQGHDFTWYIIGEGYKRRDIEPRIREFSVGEQVLLLGAKDNPYPYFKNCDLFVQTSTTEGYCITTAEAKLFRKPVVTTDIPVMHEQFEDHVNGLIAPAITSAALASSIGELLSDEALRQRIAAALEAETEDSDCGIQRLYAFLQRC